MLLDTLLIHCTTYTYSYYYSYISVCVMYLSEKCCFMLSGMGIRGLPSFQRTGIYSFTKKYIHTRELHELGSFASSYYKFVVIPHNQILCILGRRTQESVTVYWLMLYG